LEAVSFHDGRGSGAPCAWARHRTTDTVIRQKQSQITKTCDFSWCFIRLKPLRLAHFARQWKYMPQLTLRTTVNGREEAISEYICDWPDCPQPAVHVLGVVRGLRLRAAVCAEHAARIAGGQDRHA
jgi:hypothetical protein